MADIWIDFLDLINTLKGDLNVLTQAKAMFTSCKMNCEPFGSPWFFKAEKRLVKEAHDSY